VPELTLGELTAATDGTLLRGDTSTRVSSYVIDTRRMERGGVFFALKGRRRDGHNYLGQAAKRGAAAAVVSKDPGPDAPAPPALILVDDTVAALGSCGPWLRRRLSTVQWLALTGSNGKTTTRELIAAGLSATRRVHRSRGNFNNHLGVPLSMLACPDDAEYVVLELAMSGPGEIAELTAMCDPDVGLVTNVRAVHLQFFNSLDDIAAAKGELFAVLRDDAIAAVNLDDGHLRVQAARHAGPRVTFGRHAQADLRLEELTANFVPGVALTFRHEGKTYNVQLRLGGAHSGFNALAALAVLAAAKQELEPAIAEMERLEPGPGRGKVYKLEREMLLIDDAYNSSPAALASVLDTLRLSQPPGRKVLVMGDMLELGNVEGALHREAGKRAAGVGVQLLVTVGSLSRQAAETARRGGVPEVHHHADSARCAESLAEYLRDGDLVVVKGSRSMRMERVVQALLSEFEVVA